MSDNDFVKNVNVPLNIATKLCNEIYITYLTDKHIITCIEFVLVIITSLKHLLSAFSAMDIYNTYKITAT